MPESTEQQPQYDLPDIAFEEALSRMKEFSRRLVERSKEHMLARRSGILTETDVQQAYRDLTIHRRGARLHIVIGDVAMLLGGAVLALGLDRLANKVEMLAAALSISGLALAAIGVYLREFAREPRCHRRAPWNLWGFYHSGAHSSGNGPIPHRLNP